MSMILCFGFWCVLIGLAAIAENVPMLASARKTPARTMNRPIKTRKLKKADREADFFFIEVVHDVDGILVWSVACSETATSASTPSQGCVPQGFIGPRNFWQAFFSILTDCGFSRAMHCPTGVRTRRL